MAALTNTTLRQHSIFNVQSPVMQAVSCIPFVGILPSVFAKVVLIINKEDALKEPNVSKLIEVIKVSKEYNKINALRNLLSVVLVVGAIALGMLSGPTGLILATPHLLFAFMNVHQIRINDRSLNTLQTASSVTIVPPAGRPE